MSSIPPNISALIAQSVPLAVRELNNLVRIPSVSWPAFDQSFVRQSAEAVVALADQTGVFDSVEILTSQTPDGRRGNPAVVCRKFAGQGWPTVLLYAHHDVQPPGDSELWNSDPFEPTTIGDRLYGRGTADDKAGILVHLTAVKLLESVCPENELGLVLFIEGEEEYGSPSFQNFLIDNKKKLSADVIIVADSGNWDIDTPALTSSLRGNVTFNLSISTLDHSLHSGMFGGAAPDAFMAFTHLSSSFYNKDGSVAIKGLKTLDTESPVYSPDRFRQEAGLLQGVELIGGENIARSLWLQPAITVTGIDFPSVAEASNTLTPQLTARISLRVAPHQDAEEAYLAISEHIRENLPYGAHFEVSNLNLGEGYFVDTTGKSYAQYLHALETVWGKKPVNMGVGGSIPFISDFVEMFPSAEVLVTGVEDPDSRAHSPNESLHLPSFEKGIGAELLYLVSLCQNQ